jgi:hypothetical protein
MVPGKTEGDLVDEYILHDESPGKTLLTSFFEEKHEKATARGRVSFSSDGENTAMLPFRGVWGRKASLWRVS